MENAWKLESVGAVIGSPGVGTQALAWQLLPAANQQCRVAKAEACCPTSRRAPEACLAASRVWFRADVCVPLQEPEAATVSVA